MPFRDRPASASSELCFFVTQSGTGRGAVEAVAPGRGRSPGRSGRKGRSLCSQGAGRGQRPSDAGSQSRGVGANARPRGEGGQRGEETEAHEADAAAPAELGSSVEPGDSRSPPFRRLTGNIPSPAGVRERHGEPLGAVRGATRARKGVRRFATSRGDEEMSLDVLVKTVYRGHPEEPRSK